MEVERATEVDPAEETGIQKYKLEQAMKSGASWFYWIAGLSLVNSVSQLMESDWGFFIGLGVTQVIDAVAMAGVEGAGSGSALAIKIFALCFDVAAAAVFMLLGWLAHKPRSWAFVLGMILYAIDGVLFLFVQDWLGLGFHAFALFSMYAGYSALRKLKRTESMPN